MDRVLADARVDLIVLDLMLPGEDGLSICRRLRAISSVPILMLTAKARRSTASSGWRSAPTTTSPSRSTRASCSPASGRSCAGAAARRLDDGVRRFGFCGFVLDSGLRQLLDPDGAQVSLTGAEFDLLHALCLRPGRVLSRDQLSST